MFSENFASYTAGILSLYFSLGIAKEGLGFAGVHTPEFNIHPEALDYGRSLLMEVTAAMSAAH
ncbi:MAG: amidohydrolase [Alphaproteobacteria bacterium]|nr:amidohydrolase [Alphaproteobacteria bacterium]